ncbi:MAG: Fimbrial protein [Collimonas fungivorans]|nr:Fimbrial protein [Collimonas fungivorans]
MNYSYRFPLVFKLRKPCLAGLLCLMGTYATPSLAACTQINGWSNRPASVQFKPIITVRRDVPVGTILDTQVVNLPNEAYMTCGDGFDVLGAYYGTVSGPGPIGNTNLAGVGARITFINQALVRQLPYQVHQNVGGTFSWINASWKIELIKTGPITAGKMAVNAYAGYGVVGLYFSSYLNITGGGQIVPLSCSVSNAVVSVPLGEVNLNKFTGPGSTVETPGSNFNVALDCDAGARVNITLDGIADSSGAPGVLALSPASGTVAQGAGVQLLHSNTPVTFGAPIAAGAAAVDGNYNIPLMARYYQTAASVKPGVANSTVTFTMTYN